MTQLIADQFSSAMEARASWMIDTYRNQTIGGTSSPNGLMAQKFGWADILARLHRNPNDPVPIRRFVNLLKSPNILNSSFMPAGAGWILTKYWDKFTPVERNSIILPGLKRMRDLLNHGTESNFLVRYVGAHLLSQLWPTETNWYDARQRKNITSSELSAIAKQRLLNVLRGYYSKGYNDHLSPHILSTHFYALHALYSSTQDAELKAAASAALTFHAADMAANFFQGATIAPYNRPAPSAIVDAQKNITLNTNLKALYWLYWAESMNTPSTTTARFAGHGPSAGALDEGKHFAVTSALSDWRPPAVLASLANGGGIAPFTLLSAAPGVGEFGTGTPAHTLRTVYRDESYAVGSGIFTHRINNGFSERMGMEIVYKTTDEQNSIVFHHPYWRTNSNQYRWLSRSSPFQQNVQHQGTVISLFNIPKVDPFAGRTRSDWEQFRNQNRNNLIQQAWIRFPKAIDELVQANGWIFLREDQTYIAIRPANTYTIIANEFPDFYVVRSPGAVNAIVSDIATAEQFGTFTQFRSAVLAAPLTVNLNTTTPTVSYRNVRGDTITAQWNQPNYSAPELSSWPTAIVNGVLQAPDPDFINGRAVIKSDPLTLAQRVLSVNVPAGSLEIDWSNPLPVFRGAVSLGSPPINAGLSGDSAETGSEDKTTPTTPIAPPEPAPPEPAPPEPAPPEPAPPEPAPHTAPVTTLPSKPVSTTSTAFEARASWMINTYKNFTIGAPSSPNGFEAQKFGWADILSRLDLNPNDPAPIQRFLNLFKAGNVNGAFMPAGAGWILTKYWHRFTPQERNLVILPVLKKSDALGHQTENIFLIKYVGAYLFSQLWPNEKGWRDNTRKRQLTSSEMAAFTKQSLLNTLRSYYSKGYHETLSPNYLSVHIHALQTLYNTTTDVELKAAADAALTFHFADMAANFFQGATLAPYNRPSPSPIHDPPRNVALNNHIKALYWLYWAELMNSPSTTNASFVGFGPNAGARNEARHFAVTSALSSWRPPAVLTALAQGSGIGPYTLQSSAPAFGEFATGAPGATLRTVYRDDRFAVGSGIFRYRINNGLSEEMGMEIVYKSTDDQNSIVFHHPYWRTNANQYKWLGRSSPFQQNVQHQSTLISLFNIPKVDPFGGRTRPDYEAFRNQNRNNLIQEAWIRYPKAVDEVVQTGGWIFLREEQTYIAIRPWNSYKIITNEFPGMNVIRSAGATNAIISDIATVDQFATFAQFRSSVLSSPITVNLNTPTPHVSYRNVRGETITARWTQSNYAASHINQWPSKTVNGVVQTPDQDFLQGKAVIKSDPLTVANRVLTVNIPAGRLEVDWTKNMPAFTHGDYRASYASRSRKPISRRSKLPLTAKDNFSTHHSSETVDSLTGLRHTKFDSLVPSTSIGLVPVPGVGGEPADISSHSFNLYLQPTDLDDQLSTSLQPLWLQAAHRLPADGLTAGFVHRLDSESQPAILGSEFNTILSQDCIGSAFL
jgi:hypothetical protein